MDSGCLCPRLGTSVGLPCSSSLLRMKCGFQFLAISLQSWSAGPCRNISALKVVSEYANQLKDTPKTLHPLIYSVESIL